MSRNCCEYDCEGCGVHVFAFGIPAPPDSMFCATCAWWSEFVPSYMERAFTESHCVMRRLERQR